MLLETSFKTALTASALLVALGGCATDEWAERQYGAQRGAQVQSQSPGPIYPAPVAPPPGAMPAYGAGYGPPPGYQSGERDAPSYGANYAAPSPPSTPATTGGMPGGYVPSVGPSNASASPPSQQTTARPPQIAPRDGGNFIIESE